MYPVIYKWTTPHSEHSLCWRLHSKITLKRFQQQQKRKNSHYMYKMRKQQQVCGAVVLYNLLTFAFKFLNADIFSRHMKSLIGGDGVIMRTERTRRKILYDCGGNDECIALYWLFRCTGGLIFRFIFDTQRSINPHHIVVGSMFDKYKKKKKLWTGVSFKISNCLTGNLLTLRNWI